MYELDPEKIMYYSNVFVLLTIELVAEYYRGTYLIMNINMDPKGFEPLTPAV